MIVVKTPMRVSFMGGGTDFEDFYTQYPGRVISTTIDKYVYLIISEKFSGDVRVSYSHTENVATAKEVKHTRVRAILEKMGIEKGIEIVSVSDLPSDGTGLASSSAFTAGLLRGLHEHIGDGMLAEEACDIEIRVLGEPIGKQDQYAVSYGGLNMINFDKDGVTIEPIRLEPKINQDLQNNLMFFYTEKTRSANSILKEQKDNIPNKFDVLKKISDMVIPFREALEMGLFKSMGEMLDTAWELKKELSSNISDPEIDNMYDLALKHGAWGGKILGAGGGGFLMLLAPPDKHEAIRSAISWREVKFKFSNEGSTVVYKD